MVRGTEPKLDRICPAREGSYLTSIMALECHNQARTEHYNSPKLVHGLLFKRKVFRVETNPFKLSLLDNKKLGLKG